MIYRKIFKSLLTWKSKITKKPIVLRGARQVGKSTIARELGKHYSQYIELNLEKYNDAQLFDASASVQTTFEKILLDKNIEFIPNETLLFIDEIQEVPHAISLLRYFYEEMPELDVIAAGSLLDFVINDVPSFPVGRVEQIPVYPLDFEEFMEGLHETVALKYYREQPTSMVAYDKLMSLYHEYLTVGGMPEVVSSYIQNARKTSSLSAVYGSIWDTYIRDIEKYGKNQSEKKILRHIIANVPYIRDRITLNGFGNSSYKSKEIKEALRKLDYAGIVRTIYPTNDTSPPARPNIRRKPKLQLLDTGLLNYAAGIQSTLIGIKDFNSLYKGYITNHMIIQELMASSIRIDYRPMFWTRENANSNAEVDLVINYKNLLIPIEIKSGAKGRLRSLHEYMDRTNHRYAVRLLANTHNIEELTSSKGKTYTLINLPYFSIGRLDYILDAIIKE